MLNSSIVSVNQTYQTTDYDLFKKLNGNRPLSMVHVKRLEGSIRKYGMLQVDLIVNEHYEVIDGQNRLQAAKNAKSPVNYKIVRGYGLREAKILNENMSKWKKSEHLDSYCALGYTEYIKFREFMTEYKDHFSFLSCEKLLTVRTGAKQEYINGKRVKSKFFEHGYLTIPDLAKSHKYAQQIIQIKPFYKGYNRSIFVQTMISLFQNKNFSHDEFIRKLGAVGAPKLEDCGKVEQYKFIIEDIYNFRRADKVNLRY
jgi:hypothetical protein